MLLEKNEFTIKSLIYHLSKKYGQKSSGELFNHSDIAQYQMRGYLPHKYGGNKIDVKYESGVKILILSEDQISNIVRTKVIKSIKKVVNKKKKK